MKQVASYVLVFLLGVFAVLAISSYIDINSEQLLSEVIENVETAEPTRIAPVITATAVPATVAPTMIPEFSFSEGDKEYMREYFANAGLKACMVIGEDTLLDSCAKPVSEFWPWHLLVIDRESFLKFFGLEETYAGDSIKIMPLYAHWPLRFEGEGISPEEASMLYACVNSMNALGEVSTGWEDPRFAQQVTAEYGLKIVQIVPVSERNFNRFTETLPEILKLPPTYDHEVAERCGEMLMLGK